MLRWSVRLAVAAGAVGGAVATVKNNKWEVSTIGLMRFGRAAVTVGKIAADYKISLRGVSKSSVDYQTLKSEVHTRSAQKLLDLCCKNGGAFIKVGQHIGALDYLLPQEYVSTLKVLHTNAPKSPLSDILQVIKEDLQVEPSSIFSSFEEEPIGAASLAQVHKAVLKDGTKVAVKVQHVPVRAHSVVDMATMELLVKTVKWMFPEFSFMWLAEETKRNLPLELDFLHEGRNAEQVKRMFSHFSWLKIPAVYWELSSPRVLTMEFCDGCQVNDKTTLEEKGISSREVSYRLGQLYSEMIFVQGYIHCDPHPGNILVAQSPQGPEIVLLDHGLYSTLTDKFRLQYCNLWLALLNADTKGMHYWGRQLGVGDLSGLLACIVAARSWTAITTGIDRQQKTEAESNEIRNFAAEYLPQIAAVLNKVSREMLLILKTNDLLRGIEASLGTAGAASSFISMSQCCVRAVSAYNMKNCSGWWCRFKVKLQRSWAETKITLYKFYLWVKRFSLPRWVKKCLCIV
ncbi:aarF domain containing kinase 1 isoform X2 [Tachypleus tridentatus]|uniref:aarF domain containing kinase 1 isoform X2 n=1 Tax=Tachypleus tridentatus TaxID=6853 RepID=UPI003FD11E49